MDLSNNIYENKTISSWDDLDLHINLMRGIYAYGFEKPSPIQSRSIYPIINGKDVIAQAQSGTGKTGCFTIASLQMVDQNIDKTQIIIISPTRELSQQIKEVIDQISINMKKLKIKLLIGGTSTENDITELKNEVPHIIVGCPGRVHDMIRRNYINADDIKLLVLDEADEMLSTGFKDQIYNIFEFMSVNIQVALFSATLPTELKLLTHKFMRDPIEILVKSEQLTLEGIVQYYIAVNNDVQKYETLKDIFSSISMSQCIIYCNSIKRVSELYDAMKQDDYPVCQIHSGMNKNERQESYKNFKSGKYRVLLSSNLTARGIDIQQVSTVINFDIPKCIHTYLHRIGRSGRWGRKGVGINFITRHDSKKIKEIEEYYNTSIEELPSSFVE